MSSLSDLAKRWQHDDALGGSRLPTTEQDYFRDRDVQASQEDLKDLLAGIDNLGDFIESSAHGYEGPPFPKIAMLRVKNSDAVALKLVKMEDAVAELYLLDSYIFRRVILAHVTVKFQTLYDVLLEFSKTAAKIKTAGKLLEKIGLTAKVITLGARWLSVLSSLSASVGSQKAIARRIRFFGREARLDLADNILAFGQKDDGHHRVTKTVSTRN